MRSIIITLAFWLVTALPAAAQQDDIRGVISDQLTAFQADDFETAFTFASPTLQQYFRTPENFGAMVRNGYPMVHRPADVQFLALEEIAGDLWQMVMIRDGAGASHMLAYRMQQGPEGWRIAGVNVLKTHGVSA